MRLIIVLAIMFVGLSANDVSYNRGEMLFFANGCSSCHGPAGEGSSSYPRLANQKDAYLQKKLMDFRAGKANSVSQQMMSQFANKLSDREIEDLSYFLSHHKKEDINDVNDAYLGGVGS